MRVINFKRILLISTFLSVVSTSIAGTKSFKNDDYLKSLENEYAKQRYKAVMIDDGIPAPEFQKEIIDLAIGFLGIRYRFGGSSIRGIDCSAFVQRVYALAGIKIPRTARAQAELGITVNREDLKPGDLLFFQTYAKYPSHVGIYIGNGKMIHASSASKRVIISDIDKDYYLRHFLFAKRIFLYDPKVIKEVRQAEELYEEN
ncbi:MAG: C40 family peptidase [Aquificae bacterium]|nr:C40 family peptidase [Aquificota bacterium]